MQDFGWSSASEASLAVNGALQPRDVMAAVPLSAATANFATGACKHSRSCVVQSALRGIIDSLATRARVEKLHRLKILAIPLLSLISDIILNPVTIALDNEGDGGGGIGSSGILIVSQDAAPWFMSGEGEA